MSNALKVIEVLSKSPKIWENVVAVANVSKSIYGIKFVCIK